MTDWSVVALFVERCRIPRPQPLDPEAQSLAARRLARWQQQPPFDHPDWLLRRLDGLGCSIDEFSRILGEPSAELEARLPPQAWMNWHPALDERPQGYVNHRFAALLAPWLARAEHHLQPLLAPLANRITMTSDLLKQLCQLLSRCIERSVVLELQIARSQRSFEGHTPAERFAAFLDYLCEPTQLGALLTDYPCLAQQLAVQTRQWVEALGELLGRLDDDRDALATAYAVSIDRLVRIETGLGDTHARGRSVARLSFEDGRSIAYKPRPQGIAAWFQSILGWINEQGWQPTFRAVNVLDRGAYGWIEWLAKDSCANEAAAARFYTRLGGLLGLLCVIQATDMHLENILAAGEHPCVIDHETVFHPMLPLPEPTTAVGWVLAARYQHTLLRCGLLPQRLATIPDLSGIGGGHAAQTGEVWADYHTDAMRLIVGQQQFAVGSNQPTILGEPVDPQRYWGALEAGCVAMLRLLKERRQEFTRQMRQASTLQTRCVARPSQVYAHLRNQAWHPSVLVRGLERQLILDRLWVAAPRWPWIADLIHAEQADLAHGDIPYFASRPAARRLWSSRGAPLRATLQQAALEAAESMLEGLDEHFIDTQTALIRQSAVVLAHAWKPSASQFRPRGPLHLTARQRSDGAIDLGLQLARSAVTTPFGLIWEGPQRRCDGWFNTGPLNADWGDGITGIALFLAFLYRRTRQQRWAELVFDAVPTIKDALAAESNGVGLAWGVGGTILGLLQIAGLLNAPEIAASAACAAPIEAQATEPWLGTGIAGVALAWIALWKQTRDTRWQTAVKGVIPILEAGLGEPGDLWNGAAGCAWALYVSASILGTRPPRLYPTHADHWATLALWPWQPQPELLQTQIRRLLEETDTTDALHGERGVWQAVMWAGQVARRRDWVAIAHRRRRQWYHDTQAGQRCNTPHAIPAAGLISGWAGNGWALLSPLPPLRFINPS